MNFRSGIIRSLIAHGYEVVAVASRDEYVDRLKKMGCTYVPIPMDNKGINVLSDLLLFFRFLIVLRKEKPSIFLGYTVKPNIYGSFAARLLGIPVVNNIAGLGRVFVKNNWLTFSCKADVSDCSYEFQ